MRNFHKLKSHFKGQIQFLTVLHEMNKDTNGLVEMFIVQHRTVVVKLFCVGQIFNCIEIFSGSL